MLNGGKCWTVWTDVDGGSRDGVNWAFSPSHLTPSLPLSTFLTYSICSRFPPLVIIILNFFLYILNPIHDF